MKKINFCFLFLNILLWTSCSLNAGAPVFQDSDTPAQAENFWSVKKSGGDSTSLDEMATSHAFGYPLTGLTEDELTLHQKGDSRFEHHFSDDPARSEFGLGPVYNNSSCIACHNLDGRGSLPVGLNETTWTKLGVNEALFLRMSIENDEILNAKKTKANHYGAPVAVPGYSAQLFHVGVYGLRGENSADGQASVWLRLEKTSFQYPDGEVVELSKPIFQIRNPYDLVKDVITGKEKSRLFQNDVKISPRMGMPMFGLGLLENISDEDLLKNAKIDRTNEGVHGVANLVWDVLKEKNGDPNPISIGRFGLKASTPTISQQAMAALNGDMGVTNLLFSIESIFGTDLFKIFLNTHPSPAQVETDEEVMTSLIFYSQTLAVPPRRNIDDLDVVQGAKLFSQISCTSCHVPAWKTSDSKIHSLSNQKIYPYTDLLLHDMGEGLSDDRQDYLAQGTQWKTRALWGIGLTKVVNPRAGFLHDGRAQTLEEAILWHGGEAQYSLYQFALLEKTERQKIILFLQSL